MKKLLLLVVVSMLVCIMSSCGKKGIVDATLVVNGETVVVEHPVKIDCDNSFAIIPLVEISQVLGATVEWENDICAKISFDDKIYFFNTDELTLTNEDGSFDYLDIPPGHEHGYCKFDNQELMIDNIWSRKFFKEAMNVHIDYKISKSIVFVELK